jgi:hypothetical protein
LIDVTAIGIFTPSINHCLIKTDSIEQLCGTIAAIGPRKTEQQNKQILQGRKKMTDRDQLGRSDEKKASALLATSDCCCGVGDASSSGPPDGKSHLVWRRYCVLALAISTLSVLLCAVTWSQNASTHRRLLLVEERLKASLTIDDPQLDVKLQALLDNKLMLFPGSSPGDAGSGSSQARSRTIRQAASAPVDCLCPPGNSSPSYHRLIQHRFFFFFHF